MRAITENPGFWIVIVLLVLIWGGSKLPGASKNLAQALKTFRKEMNSDKAEKPKEDKKQEEKSDD